MMLSVIVECFTDHGSMLTSHRYHICDISTSVAPVVAMAVYLVKMVLYAALWVFPAISSVCQKHRPSHGTAPRSIALERACPTELKSVL